MSKRDDVSELILVTMSCFCAAILALCPGLMFAFFMPQWLGIIWVVCWASLGPAIMLWADNIRYGPRP